jgi:hypothetical protein
MIRNYKVSANGLILENILLPRHLCSQKRFNQSQLHKAQLPVFGRKIIDCAVLMVKKKSSIMQLSEISHVYGFLQGAWPFG